MKKAVIKFNDIPAGIIEEYSRGQRYVFHYLSDYKGPPVSLTLPIENREFEFSKFPPFLDGLLPEGIMLDSLLRQRKLDKDDYLSQLIAVGEDLVGALTVEEVA